MGKIQLFENKKDCCGCGACVNVCPKNAISMKTDRCGFDYPDINYDLCIECSACKNACGYQNLPKAHDNIAVYASASKDEDVLKKSASGGVFAVLADKIISEDGVVYGASLLHEDGKLEPKHIRITTHEEIPLIQGSKYVQSNIGNTYFQAKKDLNCNRKVLFTGTPCQIAGLKKYLNKEYDNLFTVDIICHGVPNSTMFQDFIAEYEKQLNGKIFEFYFRDKTKGQGMQTRIVYKDKAGKQREIFKHGGLLSYVFYFLQSYTYRENCYSCPFAKKERISDITMGDFWGFHEEYPHLLDSINLSNSKGVSCVLVNSSQGEKLIHQAKDDFVMMESNYEKVARHNQQLKSPSQHDNLCNKLMELYAAQGYEAIEEYYKNHFLKEKIKYKVQAYIPKGIKRIIKRAKGTIGRK